MEKHTNKLYLTNNSIGRRVKDFQVILILIKYEQFLLCFYFFQTSYVESV